MARRRSTAPPGDSMKAVAYVRVSTEDQNLGPKAQRDAIKRWATAKGVEIVACHIDHGVSGAADVNKRPGLLLAVESLGEHGAGLLVVAKRDRLARDVVAVALIDRLAQRKGARIVSADNTGNGSGPEAMLMRGMVDLFAQYERAIIQARTSAALQVKRSRGQATGGNAPFGWQVGTDGVRLCKVQHEQRAVRRARELRDDGQTYRKICEQLTTEGHVPRGARWYPATVKRVCEYEAADAIC